MSNKTLYKMIFTALMAAIVFVTTMFFKIPIPTPVGQTMVKVGNVFCLLSGMLLGPVYGGLASGIGSALYDLSDPVYAASAPFTFLFFFAMGCVCGLIAHNRSTKVSGTRRNLIGAAAGSVTYIILYISKSIIVLIAAGSALPAAVLACSTKMIIALINAAIAVAVSVLLAAPLMTALRKNGLLDKLT